jgi:nucleoside phosphorylase
MLNQPPPALLTCLSELQADRLVGKNTSVSTILSEIFERRYDLKIRFAHPGQEQDQLFQAEYDHVESEDTCIQCDKHQLVHREHRTSDEPRIHYGLIASGNQVMKDGRTRDRFAHQFGILCFEMEAAGLMNLLPCLVIRGICDYSDSHKNEEWQGYAALTTAAFGRLLLSVVPVAFHKAKSECSM